MGKGQIWSCGGTAGEWEKIRISKSESPGNLNPKFQNLKLDADPPESVVCTNVRTGRSLPAISCAKSEKVARTSLVVELKPEV